MIITAEVSELTRKIKLPTDRVLSVNGDYQVDGIAFKLPATYEGDFDFSTAAARVHWTGVDKVEHTNLITEVDGNGYPLWIMPSELTQGGHGVIELAVSFVATDATAAVTKRWISDPVSFRNRRTVNGSNEDEEAEEETTYDRLASAVASVRAAQAEVEDTNAVLSSLTGSAPVPVENRSDMVDNGHLYLYTGDETGLVTGNLYYYVNGTLTNGGKYGSMELDTTLTDNSKAAPAGMVGQIKEDLSAIDGRVEEFEESWGGGVLETVTGGSVTFVTNATSPQALTVDLESAIPDTSGASPTSPVSITGITSETMTVNGTDKVITLSNPIGKGTWNVLTGTVRDERPIIEFTSDMITGTGTISGTKPIKFSVGDIDLAPAESGIIACSHYKIYKKATDVRPYLKYQSNTSSWWIYDNAITSDMTTQEAKDYIDSLHIKLIINPITPIEFTENPETIVLTEGENTVEVSTGVMSLTYAVDIKEYVDGKVASVEDIANEALDTANRLDARITANTELSESNEQKVYKFRTDEGANTGTGSASASSSINWGIQLNIDENIEKCYSITFTPSFPSTITGEYTATRWKKASGTPAGGDVLTKIAEITQSVDESVTFEKVGTNEFISLNKSCYRSSANSEIGVPYVKMGHIDPSTGAFTSFSGVLSGTFSVTIYKAIKDDSMPLYGKKVALIGDSITEHNGRANTNHAMYLNQWTGAQIQNLGVGGTGFSTNNKYKDRIANIKADTEFIGVAASLNDMRNTVGTASDTAESGTVCGYANEFFDLLLASFPSIPIVCYSEGPWEAYRPGVTESDNYMSQMKQICLNKGIAWDDGLYRGCALRPWIQANREALYKGESGSYIDVVDNVHPNSAGQKYIAVYLKGLFEKYVR